MVDTEPSLITHDCHYNKERKELWNAINSIEGTYFVLDTIAEQAGLSRLRAAKLLRQFEDGGLITSEAQAGRRLYSKKKGRKGPGDRLPTTWRQEAWATMRIMKGEFSAEDLSPAMDASPALRTLQRYCRRLQKAGYLLDAGRHKRPGHRGRRQQYRMLPTCKKRRHAPTRKHLIEKLNDSGA